MFFVISAKIILHTAEVSFKKKTSQANQIKALTQRHEVDEVTFPQARAIPTGHWSDRTYNPLLRQKQKFQGARTKWSEQGVHNLFKHVA